MSSACSFVWDVPRLNILDSMIFATTRGERLHHLEKGKGKMKKEFAKKLTSGSNSRLFVGLSPDCDSEKVFNKYLQLMTSSVSSNAFISY